MTDRKHRSIKKDKRAPLTGTPHTIELTVTRMDETHATLESKEAGALRWPLSDLSDTLKKGDTIKLQRATEIIPQPKKTNENMRHPIDDMRRLLEELLT